VIYHALFGMGFVLVVEGLVLALAPSHVEDLLRALAALPVEARRALGLLAITLGLVLVLLAGLLG